jgi:hypothetical protein
MAFQQFHISPPHHQGNGLAENAAQTKKNLFKNRSIDKFDIQLAFLNRRNTSRNGTLVSPNHSIFGRSTNY